MEFAGAGAAVEAAAPEGVKYDVSHRHMAAEQLLQFLVDYESEERLRSNLWFMFTTGELY